MPPPPTHRQPAIANANRVTDFLLVGASVRSGLGDPGRALADLRSHGVTHILDCRNEASDAALIARLDPAMVYKNVGTDDEADGTADRWFDIGVGFARDALADPEHVLFVHCALGQARGPSMGYAVLLDRGYDPGVALALITSARPMARVGYAEHALSWHLDQIGATPAQRQAAQDRLRSARSANRHRRW